MSTTDKGTERETEHLAHQRCVKVRAFSRPSPSKATNISDAVTIKEGDLFFLAQPNGSVPYRAGEGYGLYYQDCRFLDCWDVRINGQPFTPLMASADLGYASTHILTNREIANPGGTVIPQRTILLQIERTIEDQIEYHKPALHEVMTITNFNILPAEFDLTVSFGAHFEDIFEVRDLVTKQPHAITCQVTSSNSVSLASRGIDEQWRSTSLNFLRAPSILTETSATYHLRLAPDEVMTLSISVGPAIGESIQILPQAPKTREEMTILRAGLHQSRQEWLGHILRVVTPNPLFNQVMERSLHDLRVLRSSFEGEQYFAAGLPWFGTLFGRDSIITALQTLAYDSTIAEKTLRLFARLQGTRVDEWKDEEPGKILHELRVGPLARANKIPSPYFGTVDATPLFLILVSEHYAWTGDLTVFRDLRPHVEAALHWIDTFGDHNGDGFVEYGSEAQEGYLVNQGWKDSGDAIVNADGSLAVPPIALVEVQGYVYLAKTRLATLFDALGVPETASRLRDEAATLKKAFNDRFWLPDQGIYALALQKDDRPAAVVSSNAGQALWGEIVDQRHAPAVARHMGDETMFSGWATRTLASFEQRYDPVGYHLGTVWPHDNSIIAAGLRKYGYDEEALRIFSGIFAACDHFTHDRLPEVFAGCQRGESNTPAHYPVACHPQAWASGAIPFLLQTCLGLSPDAAAKRLFVVRPRLPIWLEEVTLHGLIVGESTVDLRFKRQEAGVDVRVTDQSGNLDVVPMNTGEVSTNVNW